MSQSKPVAFEVSEVYAIFWRMLGLAVGRYGSYPTGQLLTVMTIMLLDEAGEHASITELVKITMLPKSSVSRYVAMEMKSGFLEEVIDPVDRRRRYVRPTEKAKEERKWHAHKVEEIIALSRERQSIKVGNSGSGVAPFKDILADLTDDGSVRHAPPTSVPPRVA